MFLDIRSPCYCFLENIAVDEYGNSAWKSRTGESFIGLAIPFGCCVFFWPAPTKYSQSKAAPRMQCGIFLGYRTSPGERWNGEYLVADLDDFVNVSLDVDADYPQFEVRPHITKQVKLGLDGIYFPLKRKYDWYNRTLEGLEAVSAHDDPFKPVKLDKPSNKLDARDGEPNVVLATGDPITLVPMADNEGYELEGSFALDVPYPEEPPPINQAGTDETVINIWAAVASKANRCRTTKKGGPNWSDVVMRITRDANSGKEIERLENASAILAKEILYGPVPDGPRDIITELCYRALAVGKATITAQLPKDPRTPDENSPYGYYVDVLGRRYKKDDKGIVIRSSSRPPYIPSESWCKANSKQRQRWLRKYEKTIAEAKSEPAVDGGTSSSDPRMGGAAHTAKTDAAAAAAQSPTDSPWNDSDVESCHDYDADIETEFDEIETMCRQLQDSFESAANEYKQTNSTQAAAAKTGTAGRQIRGSNRRKRKPVDPPRQGGAALGVTSEWVGVFDDGQGHTTEIRAEGNLDDALYGIIPEILLPTVPTEKQHRPKNTTLSFRSPACVARPVGKKELEKTEAALKAHDKEWNRLCAKQVWDETTVRERDAVARDARIRGEEIHMGRIFGICTEKESELPANDPRRKYKYRVVFQGNRVINQNWEVALFQDLGSSPAAMEAGKAVDCYGSFEGHECMQEDAEQAYVQAELKGPKTWVLLPTEAWPAHWHGKWRKPVVVLKRALYGHPDAGTFWEKHCDGCLRRGGFQAIESWQSCYWHPQLRLFLIVSVNDFEMAGPSENLSRGWEIIRKEINLEPPEESHLFLGCIHDRAEFDLGEGKTARGVVYNMESYLESCVERYKTLAHEITRIPVKLKQASTPFLVEDKSKSPQQAPRAKGESITCPWCRHQFPTDLHCEWASHPDDLSHRVTQQAGCWCKKGGQRCDDREIWSCRSRLWQRRQ